MRNSFLFFVSFDDVVAFFVGIGRSGFAQRAIGCNKRKAVLCKSAFNAFGGEIALTLIFFHATVGVLFVFDKESQIEVTGVILFVKKVLPYAVYVVFIVDVGVVAVHALKTVSGIDVKDEKTTRYDEMFESGKDGGKVVFFGEIIQAVKTAESGVYRAV